VPRQTLNKTIAARKLHPRTMTALPDQEVTIPYGAIIENVVQDRDVVTFNYLSEPYRCPCDVFQSAVVGGAKSTAGSGAPAAHAPAKEVPAPALQFEPLRAGVEGLSRAKVPGGWLIATVQGGMTFYPDADHAWNGESV
jgi:hypothetical protein